MLLGCDVSPHVIPLNVFRFLLQYEGESGENELNML